MWKFQLIANATTNTVFGPSLLQPLDDSARVPPSISVVMTLPLVGGSTVELTGFETPALSPDGTPIHLLTIGRVLDYAQRPVGWAFAHTDHRVITKRFLNSAVFDQYHGSLGDIHLYEFHSLTWRGEEVPLIAGMYTREGKDRLWTVALSLGGRDSVGK